MDPAPNGAVRGKKTEIYLMQLIEVPEPSLRLGRGVWPRRLELIGAAILLLAIWVVQLLAVFRADAVGQDFRIHYQNMLIAAENPLGYLFGSFSRTNPPLFYLVGGAFYRWFGPDRWIYAIGFFNSLQNIVALVLFYRLALWLIPSRVLRLSALAFVGFLPAFQIASLGFAACAF